jgi:hypothetical protein
MTVALEFDETCVKADIIRVRRLRVRRLPCCGRQVNETIPASPALFPARPFFDGSNPAVIFTRTHRGV